MYKACLDPTAGNYQYSCDCNAQKPSATISDPTCCNFPCSNINGHTLTTTDSTGTCITPIADGNATIQVSLTTGASTWTIEYWDHQFNSVICTDPTTYTGSGTANSYSVACGGGLTAGNYYARITDNLGCVLDVLINIGTVDPDSGCTDPTAQNYDPNATCDDGSCIACGCMDPLANNYNPYAVCPSGDCDYSYPDNPCVPPNIDSRILEVLACLSEKGTIWLDKYKVGLADDCTIMNKWKLILIKYLLGRRNLTCLYNCADEDSPDQSVLDSSCEDQWVQGGPVTGANFIQGSLPGATLTPAVPGPGGGTFVQNPSAFFVQSTVLYQGAVIKTNIGNIYTVVSPGSCNYGCYDPETSQGQQSGHWKLCVEGQNVTQYEEGGENYIDKFINFANKYCRDCKIKVPKFTKKRNGYNDNT